MEMIGIYPKMANGYLETLNNPENINAVYRAYGIHLGRETFWLSRSPKTKDNVQIISTNDSIQITFNTRKVCDTLFIKFKSTIFIDNAIFCRFEDD